MLGEHEGRAPLVDPGAGVEVRINRVVRVNSPLPGGAVIPIGLFGRHRHDRVAG